MLGSLPSSDIQRNHGAVAEPLVSYRCVLGVFLVDGLRLHRLDVVGRLGLNVECDEAVFHKIVERIEALSVT